MLAKMLFQKLQVEERAHERLKLNNMLCDMQNQINTAFNVVDYQIEKNVTKI